MEPEIINGKKYYWADMSLEDLEEILNIGSEFAFRYIDKDYYVEGVNFDNDAKGRVGFYYIWNDSGYYPESEKAKNPDEFKSLQFIDGKTIIECFDEIRFFNS